MISTNEIQNIKPHMPVVCSEGGQFAVVDHVEGQNAIKLTKDRSGQHHYIPVAWVTSIDTEVHVDRPGDEAMKEWSTSPPSGSSDQQKNASPPDPTHTERVRSQQEGVAHPELDPQRAEKLRTKN